MTSNLKFTLFLAVYCDDANKHPKLKIFDQIFDAFSLNTCTVFRNFICHSNQNYIDENAFDIKLSFMFHFMDAIKIEIQVFKDAAFKVEFNNLKAMKHKSSEYKPSYIYRTKVTLCSTILECKHFPDRIAIYMIHTSQAHEFQVCQ